MARQIREILVRVDAKGSEGLKRISRDLGRISKDVSTTSKATVGLRNAFNSLIGLSFAGFGLRGLVQASDEIQLLRDRISVFEGSTAAANVTLEKLVDISARTAAPLATSAVSYNRLALALDDVGVKGDALLGTVEVLQNTFRLAGSSIAETRGAVIQLSQGLASGQLRGQELRSVLEANAIAGEILAKQLGVARGELLKFSEQRGGISSSEVLQALASSAEELRDRASKLSLTFEQSLALAFNKIQFNILKFNDSTQAAAKFAEALNFAVVNLADGLAILAGAFLALKLPAIVAGFTAVGAAITSALGSVAFLSTLAGGLGSLAVVVGVFAAKFLLVAGAFALLISAATDFELFKTRVERVFLSIEDRLLSAQIAVGAFFEKFRIAEKGRAEQLDSTARLEKRREDIAKRLGVLQTEEIDRSNEQIAALKEAARAKKLEELANVGLARNLQELNFLYLNGKVNADQYAESLRRIRTEDINTAFSKGTFDLAERNKKLAELNGTATKSSQRFKVLNDEFKRTGDLDEYSEGLRKLELENISKGFDDGTKSLGDFQDGIAKLELQELNRELNSGVISLTEFNRESDRLRIEELNRKFREGTIGLKDYNQELDKVNRTFSPGSALFVGTSNYIESAGTLASNLAGAIESTFNRLEDSLTDFVKTGRFEFAKFTQAILDDLTKIIIRASIIQPLAQGILNFAAPSAVGASGAVGGTGAGGFAVPFASGGIVDSPTFFNYGGNNRGVAGEAGPEAIIPLKRTASGDLGVQATPPVVNVNIINNAGVEVETREAVNDNGERSIEVLIVGTVKEALGKGTFDRQFNTQFGLRRRGA